ncbi:MAG: hypothetical protein ABIL09_14840 [Gemmatimonadota bacterium]
MYATADLYQIILVDALFLCLAAGIGLWFRAWLRQQQRRLDERLAALESQQAHLVRLTERLHAVCRGLETVFGGAARAGGRTSKRTISRSGAGVAAADPEASEWPGVAVDGHFAPVGTGRDEAYARARELLAQGATPAEVARRLGLGIAEVSVLRRLQDQEDREGT